MRTNREWAGVEDDEIGGEYLHWFGYECTFVAFGKDTGQPHPNLGAYRGPVGDDWDVFDTPATEKVRGWSQVPLAANVDFAWVPRS